MRARLAVYFIASCIPLSWSSAVLRADDPPATPAPPAAPKTLPGSSFQVVGQKFAADPKRIPGELPEQVKKAALSKMSHTFLPDLLNPAAKDCVPTLIKMLQSDDVANQYPASAGLRTIIDAARPALEDLVATGPTRVRAEAIRILGSERKEKATESTAQKLKAVLADREPELQVEAALALVELKVDEAHVPKVLEQNFPQQGERIMQDALRTNKTVEAYRGVLTLALNQKENRLWRIESALRIASLDNKLSRPVQAAIIEGISKQQNDAYRLAEKCAVALSMPSENTKESIQALTRVIENGETSLEVAAAAAATLIQIDPEHVPAYVPYLLTIINRPRYRQEKAKYLTFIGKLGNDGAGAAPALRDILPREGGTCDLLMAIVLLKIDPDHPDEAHEFLRTALAGKKNVGSIGLNQWKDITFNCAPLLPEILVAIESDDAARQNAAFDLLEIGGQTALPAIPAIEKKIGTLKSIDQAAFRGLIEKIKAAKP